MKYPMFFRALVAGLLLAGTLGLPSCVSVAAYQKAYLNDEDMKLATRKVEAPEVNFESYREGGAGANGGKVGGGCGCN